MEVHINPSYTQLTDFIMSVPKHEKKKKKVYCNRRNTVERVSYKGQQYVIKKYKRPVLLNCVVYTWFRKNKPLRAYENAETLLRKGFDTAAPIAYLIFKKNGFYHTGYFISEYIPYPTLDEVFREGTDNERKEWESAFVDYTVRLHQAGIIHRDYNARNLIVHKEGDKHCIAMIDINQLTFGKVTPRAAMVSLELFRQDIPHLETLIPAYAEGMGFDADECLKLLRQSQERRAKRRAFKHWFKRNILGKK